MPRFRRGIHVFFGKVKTWMGLESQNKKTPEIALRGFVRERIGRQLVGCIRALSSSARFWI